MDLTKRLTDNKNLDPETNLDSFRTNSMTNSETDLDNLKTNSESNLYALKTDSETDLANLKTNSETDLDNSKTNSETDLDTLMTNLDSLDVVIGATGGLTSNVRLGDISANLDAVTGVWYTVNINNVNINIVKEL